MRTQLATRLAGPTGPGVLVGLGVALSLLIPAQIVYFDVLGPGVVMDPTNLVGVGTGSVPALGVAYGGYRLRENEVDPARYPRVVAWTVGGMTGFLALNLVLIVAFPADSLEMNVGWAVGVSIYGAVGGIVVGSVEARAIERARIAERARVRAERAEVEREWLDYLNSLLRHEVLNTANVVAGQASLLASELDDERATDRLGAIQRRSTDMTRVIEDVRVLIRATGEAGEFDAVDLREVLETEIRRIEDTAATVAIEASIPEDVHVAADDLLPRVFSNLLANAVEHHDGETPRVEIDVSASDDVVVVEISDDGPGIPATEQETLFERRRRRSSEHGLGLYLVRTLVERYAGSIELVATGPDGSTFRVELPTATSDATDQGTANEVPPLEAVVPNGPDAPSD